jgi:hypothetical protein
MHRPGGMLAASHHASTKAAASRGATIISAFAIVDKKADPRTIFPSHHHRLCRQQKSGAVRHEKERRWCADVEKWR